MSAADGGRTARLLLALPLAESAEKTAASFYAELGDRFPDDAEAESLFRRLHAEERVHLSLTRFALRMVEQNPALFSGDGLEPDAISSVARGVGALVATDPPRELGPAVRAALALERELDEAYLTSRLGGASPLLASLVETLREPSHGRELHEFARGRGFVHNTDGAPQGAAGG